MSNASKIIHVGVTCNLKHRVAPHKKKLVVGFSAKYNKFKLVYFEEFGDVREAIAREKQVKGWLRSKKVALVLKSNPKWLDLAQDSCRLPGKETKQNVLLS